MITIIDYRAGNPASVRLALDAIEVENRLSSNPEDVRSADRILFPGVGAARSAMRNLRDMGLIEPIIETINAGVPFLGICLGMQVLMERSEEDGGTETLGVIHGDVKKFTPNSRWDKVPQIGWNEVQFSKRHPVLEGIEEGGCFYFVHSYFAAPKFENNIIGTTDYAEAKFASIIAKDNLVACQFHPEKSGPLGLKLLANFAKWNGGPEC